MTQSYYVENSENLTKEKKKNNSVKIQDKKSDTFLHINNVLKRKLRKQGDLQ